MRTSRVVFPSVQEDSDALFGHFDCTYVTDSLRTAPLDSLKAPITRATPLPEEITLSHEQAQGVVRKLHDAFVLIEHGIVGSEPLAAQSKIALLTAHHQAIVGLPGGAKTMYARSIANILSESKVFRATMTEATREDDLLGGRDMEKVLRGYRKGVRRTEDTIIDCDIALLDEFRGALDGVLLALNNVLHEREVDVAGVNRRARIHSAICTSNHWGEAALAALFDRIIFQAEFGKTPSTLDQLDMDLASQDHHGKPILIPEELQIPIAHVRAMPAYIQEHVTIPNHVMFVRELLLTEWRKGEVREGEHIRQGRERSAEHFLSGRAAHASLEMLGAIALLDGRREACLDDIRALRYVIPRVGTQEERDFLPLAQDAATLLNKKDCQDVDRLIDIRRATKELYRMTVLGHQSYDPTVAERIFMMFRVSSLGKLTFRSLRDSMQDISPRHGVVRDLRDANREYINQFEKKLNGDNDTPLFR